MDIRRNLVSWLPPITLALLVAVGAFLSPSFLTVNNLSNLVHYNAELALICLGLVLVIIAGDGGIDLSVGSTLALAGVLVAENAAAVGFLGSVVLAVGVGAIVGVINGLVITKGRVEPFIATFTVFSITTAVTLLYTKGGPILESIPGSVTAIASRRLFGLPLPFFYFLLAYFLGVILLRYTPFGRHIYAMGVNAETVRISGINVQRLRILLYTFSGILAGLAGLLTTARLEMGEPRAGQGIELAAISAVVVGGVSLYGGKGTITGAFVGILIFAVVLNLMNILNLSAYYQPVSKGLLIIAAGLVLSRRKSMFSTSG